MSIVNDCGVADTRIASIRQEIIIIRPQKCLWQSSIIDTSFSIDIRKILIVRQLKKMYMTQKVVPYNIQCIITKYNTSYVKPFLNYFTTKNVILFEAKVGSTYVLLNQPNAGVSERKIFDVSNLHNNLRTTYVLSLRRRMFLCFDLF